MSPTSPSEGHPQDGTSCPKVCSILKTWKKIVQKPQWSVKIVI